MQTLNDIFKKEAKKISNREEKIIFLILIISVCLFSISYSLYDLFEKTLPKVISAVIGFLGISIFFKIIYNLEDKK